MVDQVPGLLPGREPDSIPTPMCTPLSGHFLSVKNEPHCLGSLFPVCTDLKIRTFPLPTWGGALLSVISERVTEPPKGS